ncbi:MAG: hypothetical protein ACRD8U_12805 [Pyrinomonadaceae bacterium]
MVEAAGDSVDRRARRFMRDDKRGEIFSLGIAPLVRASTNNFIKV